MKKAVLVFSLMVGFSAQSFAQDLSLITPSCAEELQSYSAMVATTTGNPYKQVSGTTVALLKSYKKSVITSCRFYYGQTVGFENTPSEKIFAQIIDAYLAQ